MLFAISLNRAALSAEEETDETVCGFELAISDKVRFRNYFAPVSEVGPPTEGGALRFTTIWRNGYAVTLNVGLDLALAHRYTSTIGHIHEA